MHTFPKGISAMWNVISLVQDLNSCRRVHFLRRYSVYSNSSNSANSVYFNSHYQITRATTAFSSNSPFLFLVVLANIIIMHNDLFGDMEALSKKPEELVSGPSTSSEWLSLPASQVTKETPSSIQLYSTRTKTASKFSNAIFLVYKNKICRKS